MRICKPRIVRNISTQNMPWFAYIFDFGFPCYLNMQLELPLALSRCMLTLSLVLIELFRFKGSFALERRMSKYLNCKNTSSCEGRKIHSNFLELKIPLPTPNKLTRCTQHKKSPHIHSVSTLLTNLPYPNLCNGIWHIVEGIVEINFNLRREP